VSSLPFQSHHYLFHSVYIEYHDTIKEINAEEGLKVELESLVNPKMNGVGFAACAR